MEMRRLYLVVLVLVMVCHQVGLAQTTPPAQGNGAPAKEELAAELSVFRKTLLTGDIEAADILLFHEDPSARKILLDALTQSENRPARMAVCRVLIKAKTGKREFKSVEDFIGPLLGAFDTDVAEEARLAAEATLIFDYEQIGEPLEKFVTEGDRPVKARVNALHALKQHKDKRATIKLIELLEDQDKRVSSEAAIALDLLGIVPGDTKEARLNTIKQIDEQATEVFLANRIDSLEQQKRTLEARLAAVRNSQITLLSRFYKSLTENAAKGKFLAEHLASPEAHVKLWALEEAFQWWKGTNPDFPREQLEPMLIGSISDPHKEVRLKTAEVLASMVELSSARPLLTQLQAEQDQRVRTALFVALGWKCYSAVSAGTAAKLSAETKEIRTDTLEWARKFLFDTGSVERTQIGAQVIERLLKRDGLEDAEEKKYLDLLLSRYEQVKGDSGGTLREDLLGAMAGLCTQTSACRGEAIGRYKPLFEEALHDGSDSVRETAVEGLANVDRADALAILREGHINDPSLAIRLQIIAMAGAAKIEKDLQWLVDKIGVNSESEPAWQAMLGIFNRSGANTLNTWVDRLTSEKSTSKLTNDQKINFLKMAESKAESEKKAQMLRDVRERLASIYSKMSQFARAAECWEKLYETATSQKDKEAAAVRRLEIYLVLPKPDLAAKLLTDVLAERDLGHEDALLKSLDEHLANPRNGLDPNAVIAQLRGIKPVKERPKWGKWLNERQARLSKDDKPADKPKPPTG